MKRIIVNFLVMASMLLTIACSSSEGDGQGITSPTEPLPTVQDVFNVGEQAFVRGLTVEPETGDLWVGTSVGVLQIDLASNQLTTSFTRKDGLANEYVFAIGIDQQGYKWFGTNAGGVSRYKKSSVEGDREWQTFFPMHGLADYWVYSFAQQGKDDFWLGTWAGVNHYNLTTGKFTTYVNELINEWVYGIAVDSKNRVWFGTEGGLTVLDGESWRSWSHDDGLGAMNTKGFQPSKNTGLGTRRRHDLNVLDQGQETYNPNYVFSLVIEPDDTVWAGTWGGGVSRYDGKDWRSYTREDGLAGNIVYSMAQDSRGVFWFGTNGGISRYDGVSWNTYGREQGLPDTNVYALTVAPNGDIWAGTRGAVIRIGHPLKDTAETAGEEHNDK